MDESMHRREFFGVAASAGLSLGLSATAREVAAASSMDKLVVGVMGNGGRGLALAKTFAQQPNVAVAYVCDVDQGRLAQATQAVGKVASKVPAAVGDFRRILDDKAVDALVIATCDHWHAPAAILACAAGKHVYVEKPCSHNPREGEWMVAAARKHGRLVQMGNQRRSWPWVQEAITQVRSGLLGRPYFAQAWYTSGRPSIGRGKTAPVHNGIDYDLWQGPAPRRPFRDNYLHYNWHWFWHWGNGELGNNGVHYVDICRWALGADFPSHVTSSGGRYRYDDDQETPDTHVVAFDFPGGKTLTWEGLSCNGFRPGGERDEMVITGEDGSLGITGGGYTLYDLKGQATKTVTGPGGDATHQANFLDAVRGQARANSEIAEGHKSTLLCHLGNVAHRTGRALRCDPANGHILDDPEAMRLWTREYAPGWEPKV